MADVEFTVEQVFNALAQDGFEHLRGQWTAQDLNGVITGGCVLGQTAVNLGVASTYDDEENFNLQEQLNRFVVAPDSKWYINDSAHCGDTIIHWNDRLAFDTYGYENGYALKTYAEVIEMARDILFPYFDEKVVLAEKEWKIA